MKTSAIAFVISLLLLFACGNALAADYTREIDRSKIVAPTDEEMFERFLEVVREGTIDRKYLDEKQIAFSERLKEAARRGEGITLIKPIARNHDYFAPEFQKALDEARQGRCVEWAIHRSARLEGWQEEELKRLHPNWTKSQRMEFENKNGEVMVHHYDFKLYHANIDNESVNGDEWVFYGGGLNYINNFPGRYKEIGDFFGRDSQYMILDLNRCKYRDRMVIEDVVGSETFSPSGNITGVIEFEGNVYLFDGYRLGRGRMSVSIMSNLIHPVGKFRLSGK
ncbi:MAG: hypothetical protein AB1450_01450 [Pseudomonadota bacterium]